MTNLSNEKQTTNSIRRLFIPVTIILSLLLIADLLFKGALYQRLPATIQNAITKISGK